MGISFGDNNKKEDGLRSTIDWLNKQSVSEIQKWLLKTNNKRIAIRILSLDDAFISDYVNDNVMFEIFKILPFAATQIDWVKDHPKSATGLLWHFEAYAYGKR